MVIAITGGIGSGKSYVCGLLEKRGFSIYDCDSAAKRLMMESQTLQRSISEVVGEEVFPGGILNKARIKAFIVSSEDNARKINAVVHPAVAADFVASGYECLESAILFESAFHTRVHIDYIVCVVAPLEVRIGRVMKRDSISREEALEWIGRQMAQEEKQKRSDFCIINDGTADLDGQIDCLIKKINNETIKKQTIDNGDNSRNFR